MNYEDDCDDGKMVMEMLFLFGKIVVGLEEPFFEAINSIHTHTHTCNSIKYFSNTIPLNTSAKNCAREFMMVIICWKTCLKNLLA